MRRSRAATTMASRHTGVLLHAAAVSTWFLHMGDLRERLGDESERLSELKRSIIEVVEPFVSVDTAHRHAWLLSPLFIASCVVVGVMVLFFRGVVLSVIVPARSYGPEPTTPG